MIQTKEEKQKEDLETFVRDRFEILSYLDQEYNTDIPKFKEYDMLTNQYRHEKYPTPHSVIRQADELEFGYKALDSLIQKYVVSPYDV